MDIFIKFHNTIDKAGQVLLNKYYNWFKRNILHAEYICTIASVKPNDRYVWNYSSKSPHVNEQTFSETWFQTDIVNLFRISLKVSLLSALLTDYAIIVYQITQE